MNKPTIFISYSHDNESHRERVLALSERLRNDGLETRLDRYVNGAPPEGWPRWMLNQLDAADYVLVVCTETYYRRFRGHEEPDKGKGVDWEGALITQELYDVRNKTLKFVPVLFSADHHSFIPEPLRSLMHYTLTSEGNYQSLYDFLLGQAGIEPGEVGDLKIKPRKIGQPLTFDDDAIAKSNSIIQNAQTKVYANPIAPLPRPLTEHLFGRDEELKLLDDAWANDATNIVVFHAIGGAGKSALVSNWLAKMAKDKYRGAARVFGWSFFSQGSSENRSDSSEVFIDSMLRWFDDTEAKEGNYFSKAERLAELIRSEHTLLILDGLEPLQYPPNAAGLPEGSLKDKPLQLLLDALAAEQSGLCVITSRERLSDLNASENSTVWQRPLDHLPYEAGAQPIKRVHIGLQRVRWLRRWTIIGAMGKWQNSRRSLGE